MGVGGEGGGMGERVRKSVSCLTMRLCYCFFAEGDLEASANWRGGGGSEGALGMEEGWVKEGCWKDKG